MVANQHRISPKEDRNAKDLQGIEVWSKFFGGVLGEGEQREGERERENGFGLDQWDLV
jgi:hypothetical protein